MDVINSIVAELKEFVNFFKMKYKYDQRGVLKRYKIKHGLNKNLTEDMWCELFVEKSAYNYCAKILLIKYCEDNGIISSKLNDKGLENWKYLVTNIYNHYGILYEISESDLIASNQFRDIFKRNDYDIYKIDDELGGFIIEKLKKYDFSNYSNEFLKDIFNIIYIEEKNTGVNLQYFYKPAKPIDYILSIKDHEEKLG